MRGLTRAACLSLLWAWPALVLAAPPTLEIAPDQLKPVNGYVTVVPKGDAKTVTYVALSKAYPVPPAILADKRVFCLPVGGLQPGKYSFVAVGSKADEHTSVPFDVVIPGPTPDVDPLPPPKPKPDDPPAPKPPVTSFKVILVYESGDTLTAKQNAVLYGGEVEAYLTTRCGKGGWGRRDKDTDPGADTTGLKEVWAAVKPKVTSTPCLAIAVNGTVTLEPFPATPADAVTLLKKYAGDK